jgi:hypothetical protein
MKKFLLLSLITVSLFIAGCESTREITLNTNGSGLLVTTTDMSGIIGMAKMAGQDKEMDKIDKDVIDTTISLNTLADSLKDLSAEDKALVKKGKLRFQMNMKEDKFIITVESPFTDPAQIAQLDKLSSQVLLQSVKKQMDAGGDSATAGIPGMPGGNDLPKGSVEDYFTMTYSKGLIEKKLNKEKYAKVGEDEGMQGLKQMSSMGAGNTTLIINLPRPAKKAEGKNVKLSEDKKKVTITNSADDFFDDAAVMEFKIEY